MKGIQRIISLGLIVALSVASINAQTLSFTGNHKLVNPSKQPATAEDQCSFCVEAKNPSNPKEVIIDARDGSAYGKTRFSIRDKVKIIVTNKNPFLYETDISIKDQPVSEAAIFGAIFTLLGGPIPDVVKALEKVPSGSSGTAPTSLVLPPPVTCPGAMPGDPPNAAKADELKFLLNALKADNQIAFDLSEVIHQRLENLKTEHQKVKTQFDAHKSKLVSPAATCHSLCETAQSLLGILEGGVVKVSDLDSILSQIEELQRSAQALKDRVKYIRTKYADCTLNTENQEILGKTPVFADGLLVAAEKNTKAQQAIRDDLAAFGKLKAAAVKTKDRNTLQETFEVGPFDSTTEITIELKRKLSGSSDALKTYATIKLKFGEAPFFTISGGLAFSTLDKPEYGKVLGFVRDDKGNLLPNQTVPVMVVGLTEQADMRLSPIVMLNGRIYSPKNTWIDGIHISLGITAKNTATTTNAEFLLGPSFSFLERNMFLTLGGYVGKQSKLSGDLYPGRAVTDTQTITVQSNYRWNFGAAITYKIK